MARVLSSADVRTLLSELVAALAQLGNRTEIFIVGGAAIALENPNRTATNDIDGFVRHVDASGVVKELQEKWGLETDWFSERALLFRPPIAGDDMFHIVMSEGDVSLFAANLDALLAMKLHAARAKDQEDIAYLLGRCQVTSVEAAEAVFDRYYPGEGLSETAIARIGFALGLADTT